MKFLVSGITEEEADNLLSVLEISKTALLFVGKINRLSGFLELQASKKELYLLVAERALIILQVAENNKSQNFAIPYTDLVSIQFESKGRSLFSPLHLQVKNRGDLYIYDFTLGTGRALKRIIMHQQKVMLNNDAPTYRADDFIPKTAGQLLDHQYKTGKINEKIYTTMKQDMEEVPETFCDNCGSKILVTDLFCVTCGKELQ